VSRRAAPPPKADRLKQGNGENCRRADDREQSGTFNIERPTSNDEIKDNGGMTEDPGETPVCDREP